MMIIRIMRKESIVGAINAKKFGLAVGLTFAILHLGCVMVILFTPRETTVAFFNTLLHGLDVTSILRTDMSAKEMAYGFFQIFVIGWFMGCSIASIYNFHLMKFDNKTRSMTM